MTLTKRLFFYPSEVIAGGASLVMSEAAPQNLVMSPTGWTIGNPANGTASKMEALVERASATFVNPIATELATFDRTACFVSATPYRGTIRDSGVSCVFADAVTLPRTFALFVNFNFQLWAGSSLNPGGAARALGPLSLGEGQRWGSFYVGNFITGDQVLDDEYLFLMVALGKGAGTGAANDDLLIARWGSTGEGSFFQFDFDPYVPPFPYRVRVGWNGSAIGGTAADDITADLLEVPRIRYGIDYSGDLVGKASPGMAEFRVRNPDGHYSPLHADYYGQPDAIINFPLDVFMLFGDDDVRQIWAGKVKDVSPGGDFDGEPSSIILARGPLQELVLPEITTSSVNGYTGEHAATVIEESGLSAPGMATTDHDLDTGQVHTSGWYASKQRALAALFDLAETELGQVYDQHLGQIRFESRNRRLQAPHTQSQATFSDAANAPLRYFDLQMGGVARLAERSFDRVDLMVQPSAVGSRMLMGTLRIGNPFWVRSNAGRVAQPPGYTYHLTLATPGQTYQLVGGVYRVPAPGERIAIGWEDPEIVDVTGVDPGDLVVTVTSTSTSEIQFDVKNNGSGSAVYNVNIYGTTAIVIEPVPVHVGTGKKNYPHPSHWYESVTDAESAGALILNRFEHPRGIISLSYHAHRNADQRRLAADLHISDRLTIVATGSRTRFGPSFDVYIEAIIHQIRRAGVEHDVNYLCSTVDPLLATGASVASPVVFGSDSGTGPQIFGARRFS